jgi:hypothetical protein
MGNDYSTEHPLDLIIPEIVAYIIWRSFMNIRVSYYGNRSETHNVINAMIQLFCEHWNGMASKSRYFRLDDSIVESIKEFSIEVNDELCDIDR